MNYKIEFEGGKSITVDEEAIILINKSLVGKGAKEFATFSNKDDKILLIIHLPKILFIHSIPPQP